ncbi:hypothetical protein GCM10007053_23480 [Halioglobus pacificus]|uniref:Uncharacterized protein n=1 Tax=Parahalioglobus pacificus TaxID=930806 RepID=A0A919CLB5_9GAMM|nr:hypothetical protein GCM10007053_23480 [Halioglobus pacificus]
MQIGVIDLVNPGLGVIKLGNPPDALVGGGVFPQIQGLVHVTTPAGEPAQTGTSRVNNHHPGCKRCACQVRAANLGFRDVID